MLSIFLSTVGILTNAKPSGSHVVNIDCRFQGIFKCHLILIHLYFKKQPKLHSQKLIFTWKFYTQAVNYWVIYRHTTNTPSCWPKFRLYFTLQFTCLDTAQNKVLLRIIFKNSDACLNWHFSNMSKIQYVLCIYIYTYMCVCVCFVCFVCFVCVCFPSNTEQLGIK